MGNLTTIDDIRRLESRIKSDERQRAFNRRLTERLELIGKLGAASRNVSPATRRKLWRLAIIFQGLPPWVYEQFRDAMRKRRKMTIAKAALKAGHLDTLNDDELLELGGEISANGGADVSLRELETVYGELQKRCRERGYMQ